VSYGEDVDLSQWDKIMVENEMVAEVCRQIFEKLQGVYDDVLGRSKTAQPRAWMVCIYYVAPWDRSRCALSDVA
jgi:hypothetical protein